MQSSSTKPESVTLTDLDFLVQRNVSACALRDATQTGLDATRRRVLTSNFRALKAGDQVLNQLVHHPDAKSVSHATFILCSRPDRRRGPVSNYTRPNPRFT